MGEELRGTGSSLCLAPLSFPTARAKGIAPVTLGLCGLLGLPMALGGLA